MIGARFDRFARIFATRTSRRTATAAAIALAFGGSRSALANQLTPSTCGAAGDVCTMLMGCCDGLTCVTSAINTNYGVCVTGEGGTVSIGTTLISPFSENVEQEVAAIAASETTSTTTTTTDPQADREQQIAERKSRRSARRSERKTRRSTNKTEKEGRRDDRRLARELRLGPKLRLTLAQPGTENETVRVTNQDDQSVVLSEIASYLFPANNFLFTPPHVLGLGESLLFLSGGSVDSAILGNKLRWNSRQVCDTPSDGFVVMAGFSSSSENHEFVILCDGSEPGADGGNGRPRKKKRKKNGGNNNNRNRNRG
jgi:hypothetical protein